MPVFHAISIGDSPYEFRAPGIAPPEAGCALVAASGSGSEFQLGWTARPVLQEPAVAPTDNSQYLSPGGWADIPQVTSGAIASALGYTPANRAGDTFGGRINVTEIGTAADGHSRLYPVPFAANYYGSGDGVHVFRHSATNNLGTIQSNAVSNPDGFLLHQSPNGILHQVASANTHAVVAGGSQVRSGGHFGFSGTSNAQDNVATRLASPSAGAVAVYSGASGSTLGTLQVGEIQASKIRPFAAGLLEFNGVFGNNICNLGVGNGVNLFFTNTAETGWSDAKLKRVSASTVGVYQGDGTTLGTIQSGEYRIGFYAPSGQSARIVQSIYGVQLLDGWGGSVFYGDQYNILFPATVQAGLYTFPSSGPQLRNNAGAISVRNNGNTADAPILAGAATFSGTVTAGTRTTDQYGTLKISESASGYLLACYDSRPGYEHLITVANDRPGAATRSILFGLSFNGGQVGGPEGGAYMWTLSDPMIFQNYSAFPISFYMGRPGWTTAYYAGHFRSTGLEVRNTISQGHDSTTPSARTRMLATGQRAFEVGDGVSTWQTGYREEFHASGIRFGWSVTPIARQTFTTGSGADALAQLLHNLGLITKV